MGRYGVGVLVAFFPRTSRDCTKSVSIAWPLCQLNRGYDLRRCRCLLHCSAAVKRFAALASTAVLPLMSACGRDRATTALAPGTNEGEALTLLDGVADNLLRLLPESATSLGIDTGARAALDPSSAIDPPRGSSGIAVQLRADLERIKTFNTSGLSQAVRTSFEVVRSAYATSLEGFALPYGDITVGGWRNTPYVVIQNVGAYLDVPRFLDSDHRIENATDAEAYLARLQLYAKQLDGELGAHPGGASSGAGAAGVPD